MGDINLLVMGKETMVQVEGIPLNGNPVYLRLWLLTSIGISYEDYSYDTVIGEQDRPAECPPPDKT